MEWIKNVKSNVVIGIFLLSIMFFTVSCISENSDVREYTKLVKTAPVQEISSTVVKKFPAVIEEAEMVNLAFRVAGPIQKIYVKEGDYVKKGQLIATMDPRDYEIQKTAIEAQVVQLQSEYHRIKELNDRKSVADNDYEKMKAGKEMAEAKLKNANDQLNDTKLFAPFSGYITKVMFDEGELVNHGTPIVKLIDVSQLKAEIDVPSTVFLKRKQITNIYATHDDLPNQQFPLELYANNVKANQNGLYKLYLYTSAEKNTVLTPGMTVLVNLSIVDNTNKMLAIPAVALFEQNEKSYVWVVQDSMVHKVQVETDNNPKHGIIGVTAGLKGNEQVVVGGLNLLTESEKVRVLAPKSKTNIGQLL